MFNEVSVVTSYAFRTFEFEGLTYVRRQPTINDGVMTPLMNSMVRVTDLERTIVDCIDRMKYAGGLEELLFNLNEIDNLAIELNFIRDNVEKVIRLCDMTPTKTSS